MSKTQSQITTAPLSENVLSIRGLTLAFQNEESKTTVVDQLNFDVKTGEVYGLVGESGSGKSITALSILGLQPKPQCCVLKGQINFGERDLLQLSSKSLRKIRGNKIAMIFQEPMTSLNPTFTIGSQLIEAIRIHMPLTHTEAKERSIQLLHQIGVTMPRHRMTQYPHELSGGIRQRVMIAMALSCDPSLLIADEPTTALDVTIQAQILDLLAERQEATGLSMLLITHDIGVISEIADRVAVMYAGKIVEEAPVRDIIERPFHPYTKALIRALPSLESKAERLPTISEGAGMQSVGSGCCFSARCPYRKAGCTIKDIPLKPVEKDRQVACIRWNEIPYIEADEQKSAVEKDRGH